VDVDGRWVGDGFLFGEQLTWILSKACCIVLADGGLTRGCWLRLATAVCRCVLCDSNSTQKNVRLLLAGTHRSNARSEAVLWPLWLKIHDWLMLVGSAFFLFLAGCFFVPAKARMFIPSWRRFLAVLGLDGGEGQACWPLVHHHASRISLKGRGERSDPYLKAPSILGQG